MHLTKYTMVAILSFSFVVMMLSTYTVAIHPIFVNILAEKENEAEVKADIEQENKCKQDTECENENKLNNKLNIINTNNQTTKSSETTLNVIKEVLCYQLFFIPDLTPLPIDCTEDLVPENFQITVSGINAFPSEFSGSSDGTLVTLSPGDYSVSEVPNIQTEAELSTEFSGDCNQSDILAATGSIDEGEHQKCTITNKFTFPFQG